MFFIVIFFRFCIVFVECFVNIKSVCVFFEFKFVDIRVEWNRYSTMSRRSCVMYFCCKIGWLWIFINLFKGLSKCFCDDDDVVVCCCCFVSVNGLLMCCVGTVGAIKNGLFGGGAVMSFINCVNSVLLCNKLFV